MVRKTFTAALMIVVLYMILGGCSTFNKVCKAIEASQEEVSDPSDTNEVEKENPNAPDES